MPRPSLNPTSEQRQMAKTLAAVGVSQEQIAHRLGIRSVQTLRKYFRQELDDGGLEANANVGKALYKAAASGNVLAMMFWLKCRAGWKEHPSFGTPPTPAPPFVVAKAEDPS